MADTNQRDESKPVSFARVLMEELGQIDARRRQFNFSAAGKQVVERKQEPTEGEALRQAADRRLVGLAFSGGGIRSATFNLGLLQGLAGLNLLKYVDYLSTVSGGGYIGAWLATWIKREG